jgi:hypothetical protein
MGKTGISLVSGAALLALTGTASAGPMSVAGRQTVALQSPIEQAHYWRHHYWRHHYRHYGWNRGWHYRHYGWNRGWHYRHYGWYRHRYYYGWNPAAAAASAAVGLATLPFAVATGWPYYGYPYYW